MFGSLKNVRPRRRGKEGRRPVLGSRGSRTAMIRRWELVNWVARAGHGAVPAGGGAVRVNDGAALAGDGAARVREGEGGIFYHRFDCHFTGLSPSLILLLIWALRPIYKNSPSEVLLLLP